MAVRREKCIRDIVRLEVAALLHLAATGKSEFCSDIIQRADPTSAGVVKDELRKIEDILRTKVSAEDEA